MYASYSAQAASISTCDSLIGGTAPIESIAEMNEKRATRQGNRGTGAPEADVGLLQAQLAVERFESTASASRRRWWCRWYAGHAEHARSRRPLHREKSCGDSL